MNDKGKRFWDNSINNIDEEYIEEMSETLYKKSLTDFNENDLVIVETEKKNKFPIFALAASIVAIIGVATITGVIIANTGIFTATSDSENDSSIVSEIEDDKNSEIEDNENSDTENNNLGIQAGDIWYTVEGDTATITRYNNDSDSLIIPNRMDGKIVTKIEDTAFVGCTSLDSIFISEFVEDIGYVPFDSRDFRMPLFRGCPNLTTINVHPDNKNFCSVDGVLFSKDMTVLYCYPMNKSDTSYIIPDGVVSIADHAFSKCTALTSVTIPEGVTRIGDNAFDYCTSLTEITIPESITRIYYGAFRDCSLESVHIPGLYTEIDEGAFSNNVALTGWPLIKKISSIVIPVIIAAPIIFIIARYMIRRYKRKKGND